MWELHSEEDWAIDEDEEVVELGSEADKEGERDSEEDGKEEDSDEGRNGGDSSTGQEKQPEAENIDGF